jgi:ABC-type multidrug transport system fused ATPase/permease subunit
MTSVERMVEYSELTSEAAVDSDVSNSWPQTGEIRAENVSLQYTPTGPIVLNDLNFNIRHQEKVNNFINLYCC